MCYGLKGILDPADGQIAHMDRDRTNARIENLAYLCLKCHTDYDTRNNRVVAFTAGEIELYRSKLYRALGHDQVEWTITVRCHREEYANVKDSVDAANNILRRIGIDVRLTQINLD